MMNRRDLLSVLTAGALAVPLFARAQTGSKVLLQRTLDAPPRCVSLGDGKWTGFEIEFSRLLCDRIGVTLQPMQEYLVWGRALKMLESGEIQLLPNVTWREERARVMDFIGPCGTAEIYIIVRRENADTRFDSLDDFTIGDRIFANVSAAAIEPEFDQRLKTDPDFASHFIGTVSAGSLQAEGLVQALGSRVAAGRVFGAITDWFSYQALRKMSGADLPFDPNDLVGIQPPLFKPATNYLAASLHVDPGLREELHAAYRGSRQDGTFDQIWKEWYEDRQIPGLE